MPERKVCVALCHKANSRHGPGGCKWYEKERSNATIKGLKIMALSKGVVVHGKERLEAAWHFWEREGEV